MKISLDGIEIEISPDDKNIVDAADRENIGIPAPCYRAQKDKGCCKSCVVEVDGTIKNACATKPRDGMKVIINRDDLKEIEKEMIKKYKIIQKSSTNGCSCDCSGKTK